MISLLIEYYFQVLLADTEENLQENISKLNKILEICLENIN
jgi:hypothetical protein